jgi:hypothetical protein
MRTLLTIRHRYGLATCALLSAAALGTVTASAASATGTSTTKSPTAFTASMATAKHPAAPARGAFAVAYRPTANAPGDVNAANPKFAACMRGQGQKYYPDFHASKDAEGRVGLLVKLKGGKGFDPASDAYQDALAACAPILNKVGITFPDPSDLPPLPGKPGKGEGKGKGDNGPSLHTETGDSGRPGLTTRAQDA